MGSSPTGPTKMKKEPEIDLEDLYKTLFLNANIRLYKIHAFLAAEKNQLDNLFFERTVFVKLNIDDFKSGESDTNYFIINNDYPIIESFINLNELISNIVENTKSLEDLNYFYFYKISLFNNKNSEKFFRIDEVLNEDDIINKVKKLLIIK